MHRLLWICLAASAAWAQPRIVSSKHFSKVLGEERQYRIFLPAGYDQDTSRRYPVIYFFHGFGERFDRSVSNYDEGAAYGGDTLAAFAGKHDVILVRWDGYNPRTPGEAYKRPYNVTPVETHRQFPLYFPEFAAHIDQTYRTIADREHRATAGLSMGGFMSFWIAGKYPHLVGSASNFMGSSEFHGGPKEFPTEYRHTEMHRNYDGLYTRLVTGKRDFIRWYHREMNAVWSAARAHHETEDFDWDHGTPGIAKTMEFHVNAFAKPLPKPARWHHADLYPSFDVWGWQLETDRKEPGFTVLENVSRSGFGLSVRRWMPDGPLLPKVRVQAVTDPIYEAGKLYSVTDLVIDEATGKAAAPRQSRLRADAAGRLHFQLDGNRHEVGITESPGPLLAVSKATPDGDTVRLAVINKGTAPHEGLAPGAIRTVTVPRPAGVRLDVDLPGEPAPFTLTLAGHPQGPVLDEVQILDGAGVQVWQRAIFREFGKYGLGDADGRPEAGETFVLGWRDGEALRLGEAFSNSPCVAVVDRISDPWAAYDHVGATSKISVLALRPGCRPGEEISVSVRFLLPDKPEHRWHAGQVRLKIPE